MSDLILKAQNLVKLYADHAAVSDFSLSLKRGEVCALIGQNGAGKSSILRMLAQIFLPDRGLLELFNQQQIGYLPEERGLYPNMQVLEHLEYLLSLRDLKPNKVKQKASYALDEFGLGDWKNKKVKQLSKGMQQKVQILSIILHEPDLLILDEPFSGLDPVNLALICNLFIKLKLQKTAIIISTHQMAIAEDISDTFCFLSKGKTSWQGTKQDLKNYFGDNIYHFEVLENNLHFPPELENQILMQTQLKEKLFEIKIKSLESLNSILNYVSTNYSLIKFEKYSPSLEEAFKRLS